MIRRDVVLADGSPGWLLIPQPEHARLSGELAAACRPEFLFGDSSQGEFASPEASAIRQEVLAAIAHHDDGWDEWERTPQVDPQSGRPLSFTELAPAEAFAIWSQCIDGAESIGPLAAWMVAGHFSRLLAHAEHLKRAPLAPDWQRTTSDRRHAWFVAWSTEDKSLHTAGLAATALQWLWAFDEASLWLCCDGPPGAEAPSPPGRAFVAGRETPVEMQLIERPPASHGSIDALILASAAPWRFSVGSIELAASGLAIPAREYRHAAEMFDAGTSWRIHWRLAPA